MDDNKLYAFARQRKLNAIELEHMAEDELARLHRKYRDLHVDMRKHQELLSMAAKRYKKVGVMSTLRREQESLNNMLRVSASDNNKRLDEMSMKELKQLVGVHTNFKHDIKLQKMHLHEMEDQIRKIKLEIVEISMKNKASDNRYQERFQMAQINIYKLENRLEMHLNRFSCILTENIKLRGEIQHLTNERELFNKEWERFFRILELSKKCMNDLMAQTLLVYNQREEFCQKSELLTENSRLEWQRYTEEMQLAQRIMDNQKHLHRFLHIKAQRRLTISATEKALIRQQKNKIESKLKRDAYVKVWQDIQEYAESNEVHTIQCQFIKTEAYLFSLFTFINNTFKESERISANISHFRHRYVEEHALADDRAKTRRRKLKTLQVYLGIANEQVDMYRNKVIVQNTKLNSMFKSISGLFAAMKREPYSVQDLLGQYTRQVRGSGNVETLPQEDAEYALCMKPVVTSIGTRNAFIMDIYNVDIVLAEMETHIVEALKNALIYQKSSMDPTKHIINMSSRPTITTLKVDEIRNPCPLCVEDRQIISCPTSIMPVWTRSEIDEMLVKHDSNFKLMESNLHSVSKCQMASAGLALKKRYFNE